MIRKTAAILLAAIIALPCAMASEKLEGTPIGTRAGYDYQLGTTLNDIQGRAFDGNLDTYFATYARSYTWVGLDLGTPHVIDRVGWSPRNDALGPERVQLGVIQGSNSLDWLDAVPIYIITEKGTIGAMSYGEVNCSRGFRYVRFVSTGDSRCNIAELEFYGTPGEGDDSHLFQITNLPTVVVNTVDAREPFDKETDITANIIIIDGNQTDTDKPGTIRERGNGSRQFPKKPWRLKFDKKQNILDAPAKAKKWTLINNYGDKTLMRNMLAFEIARRLDMPFVSWCRPVDVVLNSEYKGCYQLCDQMEVNPGRVEITEMDENDNEGEALTGGYLVEVDAYAYQEPAGEWFTTRRGMPVTIKSPDDGGTPEQYAYISGFFNQVEERLYSANLGEGTADYRDLFDTDSFIRHFIVGELSGNTDTYWSTYMYKDRNDPRLHTGPVWDFDLAFDNDQRTYPVKQHASADYLYNYSGASAADGMKAFANRVLKTDGRTKADISRIWSIARNSRGLTSDALCAYADSLAEILDASQAFNFVRWPILNERVHMNPRTYGSYQGEVDAVKNYLRDRFRTLDTLLGYDSSITGGVADEVFYGKPAVPRGENGRVVCDGSTPFTVYNLCGQAVYSGRDPSPCFAPGLYIVRTGQSSVKIAL